MRLSADGFGVEVPLEGNHPDYCDINDHQDDGEDEVGRAWFFEQTRLIVIA